MTYTPYLVANYSTGVNTRLQPWLIPDDAQQELFDGYVYRGTMSIREGYKYYATGGAIYRESRIVHTLTSPMVGAIDSSNKVFTFAAPVQLVRGSVTVTGSNPAQSFTDDGIGQIHQTLNISGISQANPASVTTSANHNFTTGDQIFISGVVGMTEVNSTMPYTITVTGLTTFTLNGVDSTGFSAYVSGGTAVKVIGSVNYLTGAISITLPVAPTSGTVVVTYSYMPDDPVMMIATYVTNDNVKRTVVASTKYINFYNATTNTLDDITNRVYTGTKFDFFTWTNYASATSTPRLIFCNNVDVVQQYDGSSVTDYVYTMDSSLSPFGAITTLSCSFMVEFKDRLIMLRTTEDGVIFPQRIRISGTGANSDDFRITATGAGFIDIPDGSWIKGASFNRDDLIIFTEQATWVLRYTGNDTTPFTLARIDESRGCQATFSAITYLNRTSAVSPRGLIISDGYKVDRQDNSIPDFSYNEIDGANFELCFAGSVDIDRDHYLIYPPMNQDESKRILVTNYDEDNYSVYRLPLSCMGTAISSNDIDWNELLIYETWDQFEIQYGNWNAFGYSRGAPFTLGGGHHGEIWRLSDIESEDNPVKIRNITVIDNVTIEVTTDWNNYSLNSDDPEKGADYIYFSGVQGMVEINDQQFPVVLVTNNNVFRVDVSQAVVPATNFGSYITNTGEAARVIPFQALMKEFNPFVDQDKKVRCGWLYMYVNTTGTDLVRNTVISNITNANPCVITTQENHGFTTGDQVTLFNIGGTTELNDSNAIITVLSNDTFSLNGIDSTSFGVYTSGGYASVSVNAKLNIEIITDDRGQKTRLMNPATSPYQGNMTNMIFDDEEKKWYKVFINQTGKFIQFRFKNCQAGVRLNIQAMIPGFQPVGRLI